MKLLDLLQHYAKQLTEEKEEAIAQGLDDPIESPLANKLGKAGNLHLYSLTLPSRMTVLEDIPLTIVPPGDLEPTEGYSLRHLGGEILIQTVDSLGQSLDDNTIVPDTSGFFLTATKRLEEMAAKPESYSLGPAERLTPWLDPEQAGGDGSARTGASTAVLSTVWSDDASARWKKLATIAVDLMRKNKRVLLIAPSHHMVSDLLGFFAKTFRDAPLPYKSLLSCYEIPVLSHGSGISLQELGYESQMHSFFAASRSHKTALQQKYDRFRELTPILAYKGQKQRDLNEVKLLEWRLLAEVSGFQGKIKDIDKILADYEKLPIWKRLGMQAIGKNIQTLAEYRVIYTEKIAGLMKEVEIAQARIRELVPEAAIPKEMRPEYEELKDDISRLGGTKKIREMLSAGEGTNRQAFIQNKKLVAATPARIVCDPLFKRVRFDVLIAEDAPNIPAPLLLGAAGLIREQIIIAGNTQDLTSTHGASAISGLWRQSCLEPNPAPSKTASSS
ncbi:hypothetical protein [Candidatus Nitronereus thalassa]|uniref:DNA2/NAM7 helicase helicase domain-containing protein n=1 Tax=Candidatus Nitronereus thalassa TaxID=3020898 RepID=A0ABU3K6W8_9BACT|nr:hypothetical protein [Candidatus Nitronereus thalassa]MDT7042097.1 hypothetical protein [Candidatus Nitronereus thalassa]